MLRNVICYLRCVRRLEQACISSLQAGCGSPLNPFTQHRIVGILMDDIYNLATTRGLE